MKRLVEGRKKEWHIFLASWSRLQQSLQERNDVGIRSDSWQGALVDGVGRIAEALGDSSALEQRD